MPGYLMKPHRLLGEAKQRATELSTVNNISKALASQLNPDDLIKMVGDQLKDLFKANIVYLALLNQKTKIINFPYQYGDNMAPLETGRRTYIKNYSDRRTTADQ